MKYVVIAPNGFDVSLSLKSGGYRFFNGDIIDDEKYPKEMFEMFPEIFRPLPEKKEIKVVKPKEEKEEKVEVKEDEKKEEVKEEKKSTKKRKKASEE